MRTVVLRRRRRKLHLLAASTALAMGGNAPAFATSVGSDVLARCESLQSDTAVLTTPSEAELPADVAATLSVYSDSPWSGLDDIAKVGLLWVHGYVFSGGSSNGDKAGDAVIQVYTRCADGAATGAAMASVGVSYDAFTGQGSRCEAASCGSYYQATNANCVANVTNAIQCAVDGASSTLPTASGVSFWSSASSSSAIPYPQAYEHSITLNDTMETTLQVYAIHMRNEDAGVSCGNTLDTIIPCLRLEDVASGFCKPTVDEATVESFLASVRIVQVDKQSNASGTSEGDSNLALILGAGVGGGVLLVVVILVTCCCCRKKKMQSSEHPVETAAIGTTQEPSQTTSATRSELGFIPRMIGRRGKSSDSGSDNSSNAATNVNVQTNRGRRSSWYTFGNASNRESTFGRRSSMAGTWVGAAGGGKTVTEYCNESEILTTFMQDPEVFTKRIAFDELTFLRMLSMGAYGELVRLGKIRVSLRKDCPPNLRSLVMDCTQLDPDARPSSMQVAFTLKSIIAPTLRMSSSTATTASTSSSTGSRAMAGQALQRPSSSVKGSRI
ncbi:hypothetical protein PHYPSEUDO_002956 [Phytophthora pseudosyringae]|uniref:TKL protein kinase n=1 Tax=Phytophthora pseudosyringae TaxID=221518 RepID=A0A8T1VSH5_9STRA|nr:hypothetical protein PHYPSEUDO_002956 [Phytophthora pseudosyringae]